MSIAETAVAHSDGRLRIAISEKDETKELQPDVARFLKLDGKRLGRDIEPYDFMGRDIMGWETVFVDFLSEVLMPLKRVLPESYRLAGNALRETGFQVYDRSKHDAWVGCF